MNKRLEAYYSRRMAWLEALGKKKPSDRIITLFWGVVDSAAGTFISRVLATLSSILIVRHFNDVALFGQYATLMATLGLLASFLGFGLDTWLLREGGRNADNLLPQAQQVLMIKFFSAILILLVVVVWWRQTSLGLVLLIGMGGVICDSFAQTGYAILRATLRTRRVAIFQIASAALWLTVLLAIFFRPASIPLVISLQFACSAVIATAMGWSIWRLWHHVKWVFAPWAVVQSAWLFVVADVLTSIYTQSSILFLGASHGDEAVGLFRPALNLISMAFILPLLLFYVGLPMLSAANLSVKDRNKLIGVMSACSFLYGLAVIAGLWIAGEAVIHLVFGHKYDGSLPYLMIMSVVPLLKAGSFVAVAVMLAQNAQLIRVLMQCIVAVLSLVGGYFLIPFYGVVGAAWLYVGVEAVLFLCYFYGASRSLRQVRV